MPGRGSRTQVHKAQRCGTAAEGNPRESLRKASATAPLSTPNLGPKRRRWSRRGSPSPQPPGEPPHAGMRLLCSGRPRERERGSRGAAHGLSAGQTPGRSAAGARPCRVVPSRARPRRREVRAVQEPPRPAPGARPAHNFRPTPPAAPSPRPGPGTGDTPRRPRRPPPALTARPSSSSSGSGGNRPRRRAAPAPCPGTAIPPDPLRTRRRCGCCHVWRRRRAGRHRPPAPRHDGGCSPARARDARPARLS